ncbi:MAG: M15 family metallopeptidase [Herbinix sp.]|nr:M15 family metallopeptidase [Herbinix sp.]
MNRKTQLMIIVSVLAVTLISGIVIAITHVGNKNLAAKAASSESTSSDSDFTYISPTLENNSDAESEDTQPTIDKEVTSFVPATEMDLDPTSITVYVNKEHALPKDYKPDNLVTPNIRFDITYFDERTLMRPEASKALEKLFTAAEKAGYNLIGISGYRSFDRQYEIFTNNIATQGKEHTLMYSAVPGTSEHQTGLAIDVSASSLNNKLTDEFADTPEGIWLADNSYKYGFIIRYPKDKAEITGYAYEPWHIRYVGRGLSYYLYNNKLTLDEYYNYKPSSDFDFEALYADIINYVPPTLPPSTTPTMSATPTISATPSLSTKPGKDTTKGNGKNNGGKNTDETDSDDMPDLSVTPVPTPTPEPDEIGGGEPTVTDIPEEGDTGSDTPHTIGVDGNTAITDIIIE